MPPADRAQAPTHTGHLWLVGMMGAGKSTVARLCAERLGRACVDLDRRVEQQAGATIHEIFAAETEAGFRAREAALLRVVAAEPPSVIATGGGAPFHGDGMAVMEGSGVVIWIRAGVDEVFTRMDVQKRPMLHDGDPRDRWMAIESERRAVYARAGLIVDRRGRDSAEVAAEIAAWVADYGVAAPLSLPPVPFVEVPLGARSYPVFLDEQARSEARFAAHLARRFPPGRTRVALCTDETVARLHLPRYLAALQQRGFTVATAVVPGGERAKTMAEAERLADALVEGRLDRSGGVIVGLGGGALGDLAGFVAAILHRGVPHVLVPTTLLAMVDASVGGKSAVNLSAGKNLVGALKQPQLVWADLATLGTLPPCDIAAGMGEVVKHALLDGEEPLGALESTAAAARAADPATLARLVTRSVRLKASVVAADEEERDPEGGRTLLNLGHTLGHALEAQSLDDEEPLRHGESVALGLLAAARIGAALCPPAEVTPGLEDRLARLLAALGLPADLDAALALLPGALPRIAIDKKRDGSVMRYVALPAPGHPRVLRLEPARLAALLQRTNTPALGPSPEATP